MRTIPDTFSKFGDTFTIVCRTKDYCLYSRSGGESYEVMKISYSPERQIANQILEEGEYLPSSEMWGTYAWTYTNYEAAINKFKLLTGEY